jgi:predicted outer membrane repeat protein
MKGRSLRYLIFCLPISFLCVLAFASECAFATTWIVRPDGSGDFATIQAAVTAGVGGDIVELTSGTFTGPGNRDVDLLGKAITVRSHNGNPDSCIIDCQGSPGNPHRGFRFHSGEGITSELRGLTIANGHVTTSGGGVSCTNGSAPLIRDCILINNFAGNNGGALYCTSNSNLTLENCQFIENTAEIYGGAIRCYQSSPTLTGCLFRSNVGPFGGGFSCYRNCTPELTDCVFELNESAHGGGIFSFDSVATVTRCVFVGNVCLGEGGGFANFDSSPTVINCVFIDNIGGEAGGGFYAAGDGFNSITDCTFAGNSSNLGGGVYSHFATSLILTGSTLIGNSAAIAGSGIYVAYTPTELERVIIAFGQVTPALQCADTDYPPLLSCCDIYGNTAGDWSDCVVDQLGVNGNISVDPIFCDVETGDFTLREDSPCAEENNPGCGLIGSWPVACGVASHTEISPLPASPMFLQNQPNPFNPTTVISYRLPRPTVVTLRIFDLGGRAIRRLEMGVFHSEGFHSVRWDGHDDSGQPLPSGSYFGRLDAAGQTLTKKMLLMK